MTTKSRKTKYCKHYQSCDRNEDCFWDEYCPVYQFNPKCATKQETVEPTDFDDFDLEDFEDFVRDRFKGIIGGKSLLIPRIVVELALDDIFEAKQYVNQGLTDADFNMRKQFYEESKDFIKNAKNGLEPYDPHN